MTQSPPSSRIEIVDVLRGFALLGIILVHMVEQYYAGMPPQSAGDYNTHMLSDQIFAGFTGLFITGKFYMIFSFLFGLSFFLQLNKSDGSIAFSLRFLWRLFVLFAIGLVHSLHYRGDILTIYAILGVGLLLLHRLPDKLLLIVALLLIIDVPAAVTRGIQSLSQQQAGGMLFNQDQKVLQDYWDVAKSTDYGAFLKANWQEFFTKFGFQVESGRAYITLGLFLLGLYAGRKKIFESPEEQKRFFRKLLKWAGITIAASFLFALIFFGGFALAKIELPQIVQFMVGGLVFDLFNASLSAIYVAGVVLLYYHVRWHSKLQWLYPAGRMGLTTYLTQTVFGFFVFFGFGFNQLGVMGATVGFLLALVFYFVQIRFSKLWFDHFRYGPVEWVWRCLTYGKFYPIRK